jgi:hypothetical protein
MSFGMSKSLGIQPPSAWAHLCIRIVTLLVNIYSTPPMPIPLSQMMIYPPDFAYHPYTTTFSSLILHILCMYYPQLAKKRCAYWGSYANKITTHHRHPTNPINPKANVHHFAPLFNSNCLLLNPSLCAELRTGVIHV